MNITVRIVDKKNVFITTMTILIDYCYQLIELLITLKKQKKKQDINHTDFQSFNLRYNYKRNANFVLTYF